VDVRRGKSSRPPPIHANAFQHQQCLYDVPIYRHAEQQVDARLKAWFAACVINTLRKCDDQAIFAQIIRSQMFGDLAPVHERCFQIEEHDIGVPSGSHSESGEAIRCSMSTMPRVPHLPEKRVG
jgi:hypothetical protein